MGAGCSSSSPHPVTTDDMPVVSTPTTIWTRVPKGGISQVSRFRGADSSLVAAFETHKTIVQRLFDRYSSERDGVRRMAGEDFMFLLTHYEITPDLVSEADAVIAFRESALFGASLIDFQFALSQLPATRDRPNSTPTERVTFLLTALTDRHAKNLRVAAAGGK